MRYINEKTGAIVDSPSIVKGENWKLVEEKKPENKVIKKESRKSKE